MKKTIACALAILASTLPLSAGISAVTLEDAMNAALSNDSTLADARSNLAIAENNLFKSASLYGSSLSLGGSLKGSAADEGETAAMPAQESTGDDIQKSVTASLSVPLAKWLSIGLSGSTDLETSSATLSLSLNPFAKADTQAETAWLRASIQSASVVRSSMLSVRKEYRAVLTARAAYEWRKAAVVTAMNSLSKVQYLVELGKSRKSEEISVYSDLMDAQGALDTAENDLAVAIQNLALRTGLDLDVNTAFEEPDEAGERALADAELWYDRSADLRLARLALDSETSSVRQSVTFPDLSVGTTLDDSSNWSVTAKVTMTPDLLFQKAKASSDESLAIQQRAFATTERNVKTAYSNQETALEMADRNYGNAQRFLESAQLSQTETQLMFDRGEASQAALDDANENLLSARYQLAKSGEALENARDQLDVQWQLPAE